MGNNKSKFKNNEKKVAEICQSNQNNAINNVENFEISTETKSIENVPSVDTARPQKSLSDPPPRRKLSRSKKLRALSAKSVSFEAESINNSKIEKSIKNTQIDFSKSFNEEILMNLTLESKVKVKNIENLIEAIDNFNKIFSQFPEEYYRFMKKIMHFDYLIKNEQNDGGRNFRWEKINEEKNEEERGKEERNDRGKIGGREESIKGALKQNRVGNETNESNGENIGGRECRESGRTGRKEGSADNDICKEEIKISGDRKKRKKADKIKKNNCKSEKVIIEGRGLGRKMGETSESHRDVYNLIMDEKIGCLWKEHLRVVAKIQPRLVEHGVAVQKMAIMMARLEERMESEDKEVEHLNKNQIIKYFMSYKKKKKVMKES